MMIREVTREDGRGNMKEMKGGSQADVWGKDVLGIRRTPSAKV